MRQRQLAHGMLVGSFENRQDRPSAAPGARRRPQPPWISARRPAPTTFPAPNPTTSVRERRPSQSRRPAPYITPRCDCRPRTHPADFYFSPVVFGARKYAAAGTRPGDSSPRWLTGWASAGPEIVRIIAYLRIICGPIKEYFNLYFWLSNVPRIFFVKFLLNCLVKCCLVSYLLNYYLGNEICSNK